MAKVNWRGQTFINEVQRRAARGLQEAAKTLKVDYFRALGISNRDGNDPSQPGDVPRRGTGEGRRALVSYLDRTAQPLASYVAMQPGGRHLLMLDGGTRAHVIHAKGGKMLMIPWRSKGGGPPSRSTISFLGLKRIGKNWYYFRRSVNHPGTRPRPWITPVFQRNAPKIGMILASRALRP